MRQRLGQRKIRKIPHTLQESSLEPQAEPGYKGGMKLKQIIREQGRTQRWVASELGIHEDALSRMLTEKQAFPVDKVQSLADLLGMPVIEVLQAVSRESA